MWYLCSDGLRLTGYGKPLPHTNTKSYDDIRFPDLERSGSVHTLVVLGQGDGKSIFRTNLQDLRLNLEDRRIELDFPNLVKWLFQVRERQHTEE